MTNTTTVAALTDEEIAALRERYTQRTGNNGNTVQYDSGDARVIRALDALDAAQRRIGELEQGIRDLAARWCVYDDRLKRDEPWLASTIDAVIALVAPHDATETGEG